MTNLQPLLGHRPTVNLPLGQSRRILSGLSDVFRTATQQPRLTESLDYENIQNQVSMEYEFKRNDGTKRRFYGYTGRTMGKFFVTSVTGVITGIVAVVLGQTTEILHEWKNERLLATTVEDSLLQAWAHHMTYSILLVLAAGMLVQLWCPSAAGAGVAPVMAYLNGSFIPNLLNFKTLFTKFVGTICGCAANLAVGPEGPMVHMGACIAACISQADCSAACCLGCCGVRQKRTVLGDPERQKRCRLCRSFDDTDHREFVSAGTACGLAAAFGAPIGGVLFSMEEACSYWSRKVAWRCFLAAMLSAFVLSELNPTDEAGMLSFDTSGINMGNRAWLYEAPLLAACAMLTGFMGACFNILRNSVSKIRVNKRAHLLRILEVAFLGAITVTVMFGVIRAAGTCVRPPPSNLTARSQRERVLNFAALERFRQVFSLDTRDYGLRWRCPEGEYNDLATAFFASPDATIKHLFSINRERPDHYKAQLSDMLTPEFWKCGVGRGNNCKYTTKSLAIFGLTYLILMGISTGLAVPAGMFMPSIMVGSAFGATFGIILEQLLPLNWNIYPGVYALVGATSVLGGVFRASISLVVIMVEGTRGIEFLFGVIVAVVVSNWVAQHVHHHGVYESELEQDGNIHFLRLEPPRKLKTMLAREVMASPVIGLRPVESVNVICQVLRCCTHNGFPVFASNEEGVTDRRVTGLILRSQLLVLLRRGHFQDSHGRLIKQVDDVQQENIAINSEMRHFYNHGNSRSFDPEKMDALAQELSLEREGTDTRDLYLNLRPFMNQAVITVREETSAARCHEIFIALCLRHLCVVDAGNRLVGIITRKDLDRHAGKGSWRLTKPPSMPSSSTLQQDEELARLAGHPGRGAVMGRAYPSTNLLSSMPYTIPEQRALARAGPSPQNTPPDK
uniref:Chloride channel protein n=1 Tax=Tetraselmis sp. GSL018 TaxID=582737 RepID=A0A061QZ88_9CHLO